MNSFRFCSWVAFGLLMLAGLSLSACAQKKKSKNTSEVLTTATAKPVTNLPQVSYVHMRRTACFGRCPIYTIEIYENGLVRYSGKKFVEKEGVYEKNFGPEVTQALLKKFAEARPDTMSGKYVMTVSDVPDIFYIMTINGANREFQNAMFGPQILKELAVETDHVVGQPDFSWKRTATTVE